MTRIRTLISTCTLISTLAAFRPLSESECPLVKTAQPK